MVLCYLVREGCLTYCEVVTKWFNYGVLIGLGSAMTPSAGRVRVPSRVCKAEHAKTKALAATLFLFRGRSCPISGLTGLFKPCILPSERQFQVLHFKNLYLTKSGRDCGSADIQYLSSIYIQDGKENRCAACYSKSSTSSNTT